MINACHLAISETKCRLVSRAYAAEPAESRGEKGKVMNFRMVLAVIVALATGLTSSGGRADETLYKINGGDLLHISVYGEKDLDRDVAVEPDGGVAFPLVGNLNAKGLTLAELQKKIADALRGGSMLPNVTDAEVTVSLVKSTGNSFSVIGQVKQPGTFVTDTQVDVMQALSLAGGLTPFASKSRIIVLRRDAGGVQKKLPFDYSSVEDGNKLEMNIQLQGGDVVVVPQGGLGF
jgi:polysaccharide export outer membrane protein